jgi:hypothetical protein
MKPALAFVLLLFAADALGAGTAAPPHAPIHAVRLTEPVNIDGILDEPVWQTAEPVTEFYQATPDQGEKASQRTEVRIAYDGEAIYIGARCFDAAPDSIIQRLSRRDVTVPADRFSVYLDPYHDKRSGYYFLVNCAGTQFDGTLSNDGNEDSSWDGVWNAKVKRDDKGWTVEYRIPLSQIRFQNAEPQVWGINFRRVIMRRNEESFLAYVPRDESGFVSRWPDLVGLDGVHASRTVELLPYATSKGEFDPNTTTDNPFNDGSKYTPGAGFDLRTGLGSKLTLNATINPDFGQVEVDPATVNLSDVETFFQEKRPFFVEGASNFRFGNEGASNYWGFNWPEPTFFYSRRIGRQPQGDVPSADYSDSPIGTTILGAAKVVGKLGANTNFGMVQAVTAREQADLYNNATGTSPATEWHHDVEPLTYYGTATALKSFKDRNQGLGTMVSLVQRKFDDASLEDQLNSTTGLGAVDGWASFGEKRLWVLSGWAAATNVRGNTTRMNELQHDPRHYFQRPDATHIEVDPNATSMTGYGARVWLNKERGKWFSNNAIGFMSPKFELNDIGFQSRADVANAHVGTGYRWSTPGKHRQYSELIGAVFASGDFGGNVTWGGVYLSNFTEFRNHWTFNGWSTYNPVTTNVRQTRGGPRMKNPAGYEVGFYTETNARNPLYYTLNANLYSKEEGSFDWFVAPSIEWKPVSNIRLSLGPQYAETFERGQYVETVPDPALTQTYNTAYVFSTLDQTTVSADIRLTWAFTPRISLQSYVQPFISSGKYNQYKALATPNTRDFVPYVASYNPDFNIRSVRGNTVFRWEYMPGSAFYFVWTQELDNSDFGQDGDFNMTNNWKKLANAPMSNLFLAKVTYYFTL